MSDIPYNYRKYIDDVTKMTQRGAISAGEQIASPTSAGSRGLAKLTQFTNNKTQMQLGQEAIAESMVDIRSIMNRIDGLNVTEDDSNYLYLNGKEIDQGSIVYKMEDYSDGIFELQGANYADGTELDEKELEELESTNELIEWVRIDYVSESEAYESMPEGDEFNIEEDEDFEEVLGALGFPEDETELFDAEYQGRKVPLNKPMRGDVKKFKVYVKDPSSGNVKKVNFGHGGTSAKRPTMRIRKSNPKARKSFRARHNCANPGPKTKARYWSCRKW